MISEQIQKQTELSYEDVISLFESEISPPFQLFSNHILNGKIKDGSIRAVINPPIGFVDP